MDPDSPLGTGPAVPLDDASAQAQRQRLLRAWTADGPPDLAVATPGTAAGLAAGTALAVLVAAALGIGGAMSGLRQGKAPKTTKVEAASASRAVEDTTSTTVAPPPPPAPAVAVTAPVTPPPPAPSPPATAPPPVDTTPAFAYTAPRPSVSPANGAVTVTWDDLRPTGGATVQSVRVSLQPSTGAATLTREVAPTHRGTTVTGAVNGTQYTATLTAIDGEGRAGPPSAPSEPVTPTSARPSPPAKVASLRAGAVNGGVTVTWDPPTNDGGSPLQRYEVTANPGARTVEAPWGVHSATIVDLASTTAYTVSVQAVTDAAYGEAVTSAPVQPATSGPGRPDAPSAPTVTVRGDRSWTATFTPGPDSGGEGVTAMSFTVVPLPNDGSAGPAVSPTLAPPRPGSTTSVVVNGKGLNPALAYTFVVVAWNGHAASDSSPPSSPARVPATTTTTTTAPKTATTPRPAPTKAARPMARATTDDPRRTP